MELKKLLCCILLTVGCTLPGYAQDQPWARYADVEAGIEQPSFPERNFLITDFGARPDDSLALCHEAIDRAILACSLAGGGHVVVPQGTFYTGPITLKSNVDLHLEKGACLKFSTDKALYTPTVLTRWEGVDCYNLRPLIYARGETNLAITGQGTIDGQADNDSWWHMCGNAERFGWREGMISAARGGRERLLGFGETQTPVALRQMTLEDGLRPQLIQFFNCRNITLSGVFITNAPFWCIHLLKSENVICRGLRYDAKLVNNDGIDPEYTRNVLIEDIEFNNGDDNVAIKCGRDNDGWTTATPSENIIIRHCKFKGLHGVVLGSEMSAGVQRIFIEDCTYAGYCKRGIYIKTNPDRGGFIRDIYVNNCEFDEVEDLFYVTSMYGGEGLDNVHFTEVSGIHVDNLRCRKVRAAGLVLQGTEAKPITDVTFNRVNIGEVKTALSFSNTIGVKVDNCHLGGTVGVPSMAK